MAKNVYSAREAADALGISLDTLRRWDRDGRIRTRRDSANRRVVPAREIARLRGVLLRFRDFVANNGGVRDISTSRGEPTNHHNPIWCEVAEALAQKEEPSS